jgi:serine/threonine protein kinase
LAVVYFTFITDKKPFPLNCKSNNLEAILSFAGSSKFLEVFEKYNKVSGVEMDLIEQLKNGSKKFEGISLRDRVPEQYEKIFDDNLIDLLEKMMEVDPEYRLTITEVMRHPYFDRVKKLPKMYEEKNKRALKRGEKSKHAPANNLIKAEKPDEGQEKESGSL